MGKGGFDLPWGGPWATFLQLMSFFDIAGEELDGKTFIWAAWHLQDRLETLPLLKACYWVKPSLVGNQACPEFGGANVKLLR